VTVTSTPLSAKGSRTRATILRVAGELFQAKGYSTTGLREIATAAGVDPALIIRYFGTKEALFLETATLDPAWAERLAGPIDTLGERMARSMVEARRDTQGSITALLRATETAGVRDYLQQMMADQLIAPIVHRIPGSEPEIRARIFAAQTLGLMYLLFTVDDPILRSMPADRIIAYYGEALQSALTGPAPTSGDPGPA
jgi:AcrR family transcriptional regulator